MPADVVPTPRPFTFPTLMVPARIAAPLAFAVMLRLIPDAAQTTLGKHVSTTNVAQRKSVRIVHPFKTLSRWKRENYGTVRVKVTIDESAPTNALPPFTCFTVTPRYRVSGVP